MLYFMGYNFYIPGILDYAVNIISGMSGLWFLGAVLGYKFNGRVKKCLACILGGICGYLALYLNLDRYLPGQNYTLYFLSDFLYCLIFFKGKMIEKAVACLVRLEVGLVTAVVSTTIYSFVTGLPAMSAYHRFGYRYVIFRCFDIALCVLIFYAVIIFLRKTRILENKSTYFNITIVGVASLMAVAFTSSGKNYYMDNAIIISIIVGIILVNTAVYYFTIKRQKSEQARATLQQQYNFQKDYINDVNDLHQKLRQVKHDMKNHIQCVASMINDDKKEAAINYLEELSQEVSINLSHTVVTNSDVVNCILDDKFADCRRLNIPYDYVITGDNIAKVKDIDLSIILGNLLDNAIEASQNCEKKRIFLKICNEKAYLKVSVENAIDSSVLEKNPKLETIKSDGDNHGLGLKSVENIAKKYNGFTDFYEKDGMFIYSALLCVYQK